jgi:hypothetical protein
MGTTSAASLSGPTVPHGIETSNRACLVKYIVEYRLASCTTTISMPAGSADS